MSHPFICTPRVSPYSLSLAAVFVVWCFCLVCVFASLLFFCKWQNSFTSFFIYTAIGDRQCFHARSARRLKKKTRLPSEMVQSLAKAVVATSPSTLPTDSADPFPLFDFLTSSSVPGACHPTTVHAAEGLVPTQGGLLHLTLPHSLRCPADPYFTQVAMNYPHLHRDPPVLTLFMGTMRTPPLLSKPPGSTPMFKATLTPSLAIV